MKLSQKLVLLLYFVFLFSLIFTTSNDFTQDLGRHLKIGEIIVKTHSIPSTNLFSYTNPNFPFINHHWGSEVIFYLLIKWFGLNSLLILKLVLIFSSIILLLKISIKKNGFWSSILSASLLSPLLIDRNGIRPELFGYLFFSVLLYIVYEYPNAKKLFNLIPIIMILWINTHITFVFGGLLVGILIVKILLSKNKQISNIFIPVIGLLVLLINPHFIQGIVYPFTIFGNYGYTIVENQNIFFLNQVLFNPVYRYLVVLIPIVILGSIILVSSYRYIEAFILIVFFMLALWQVRHIPFFIYVALPAYAFAIREIAARLTKYFRQNFRYIKQGIQIVSICFIWIIILLFVTDRYYITTDLDRQFGLSILEQGKKGTDFVLRNHLSNNIFNTFDIGGYLIYRLYPQYKVFVDNRPEAYPGDFMQNIYIDLQKKPELRKKIFQKYNIQTVIVNHTDSTYWANMFMRGILEDPEWKLVYFDSYMFVMSNTVKSTDLRSDTASLERQIHLESNYIQLLHLSKWFQILKKEDFAHEAFEKAANLNPFSCSVIQSQYNQYIGQQNLYPYKAQELKNNNWFCF